MSAADAFLGVIGASAVGWTAPGPDGAPVMVELLINGHLVEKALAKRARPAPAEMATLVRAAEAPDDAGPDTGWFSLKAPPELRAGRPLAMELRREDGTLLGRTEVRLFSGLKAKFVTVHDGVAEGYVANPHGDDAPEALEIRLDGAIIGEAQLEPPGQDGRRRFRFPMPPEVSDNKIHEVAVCWSGTQTELPGSPVSWRAPRPPTRQLLRDREDEAGVPRSHPDYRLPAAERFAVSSMLDHQALQHAAPAAVAEHAALLWDALTAWAAPAATRLNIMLTAGAFSDIEASFALGQLLQIDVAASVCVVLPSDEAVRFAADDQRDTARHGLITPLAATALAGWLARLPPDDLVVFAPAHTVLTEAFLSALRSVVAGQADGAVGVCARATFTDASLLLATGPTEGWFSGREVVGVLRAGDLASRLRSSRFEFEGVRFDEFALQTDMSRPAGVSVCASWSAPGPVADSLLVLDGEGADLAPLADLAPQRTLAGVAPGAAPAGWTTLTAAQSVALDQITPLARAISGDADILVLGGSVAPPARDVLAACRAVATATDGAVLRHTPAVAPPETLAGFVAAAEAALAAPPFGAFLSSSARAL